MLGGKIEPRQDKTGQDRAGQDKTREDKTKTRQDTFLCGGGSGWGGGEFIPSLIRGILAARLGGLLARRSRVERRKTSARRPGSVILGKNQ